MEPFVLMVLLAFAGGMFGAYMGALPNFILCGVTAILGVAVSLSGSEVDVIGALAWGAFLGPHVGFAGGAAALSYARRVGAVEDGKDIVTPLALTGRIDVWLVGGLFGAAGYIINWALTPIALNIFNSIALTIVILALISKVLFDSPNVIDLGKERNRFFRSGVDVWTPQAKTPLQLLTIGLVAGAGSAAAAAFFMDQPNGLAAASTVGFAFSVASLAFVIIGVPVPVTHHITLSAAVATIFSGDLLWGLVFGVLAAFAGYFAGQLFLVFGRTWIDPPSVAIAFCSIFITGLVPVESMGGLSPVLPLLLLGAALTLAAAHAVRTRSSDFPTPQMNNA